MLGRLADFDAIDAGAGRRFPDVSKTFWGFYDIVEATSVHLRQRTAARRVELRPAAAPPSCMAAGLLQRIKGAQGFGQQRA